MTRILFIAAFAAFILWLLRSSYVFRFEFDGGALRDVKGSAPATLRRAFEEVARHGRLTGSVSMYPGRILRFSRGISEGDRQRFRNVLAAVL